MGIGKDKVVWEDTAPTNMSEGLDFKLPALHISCSVDRAGIISRSLVPLDINVFFYTFTYSDYVINGKGVNTNG